MKIFCKKSCDMCPTSTLASITTTAATTPSSVIECVDSPEYESMCPKWAKTGHCTTSSGFMKMFCQKSCDMCPTIECVDSPEYESKCPKWAKTGHCTTSSGFMKMFCKKSCNMCPKR